MGRRGARARRRRPAGAVLRRGGRLLLLAATGAASLATSPQPALEVDARLVTIDEAERRSAADFVGPAGADARACDADQWTADVYAGGWRAVQVAAAGLRPVGFAAGGLPAWRDAGDWARALAGGRARCGHPLAERVLLVVDPDAPFTAVSGLPAAFEAAGVLDVRWYVLVEAAAAGPAAAAHAEGAAPLQVTESASGWSATAAAFPSAGPQPLAELLDALPRQPPHALELGVDPGTPWSRVIPLARRFGVADQVPRLREAVTLGGAAAAGPAAPTVPVVRRWVFPDDEVSVVEVALGLGGRPGLLIER